MLISRSQYQPLMELEYFSDVLADPGGAGLREESVAIHFLKEIHSFVRRNHLAIGNYA